MHWDPFERLVLRNISENAKEIRDLHLRIIRAAHEDQARRDVTRALVENALDRFLLQLKPEHIALGDVPNTVFGAATTSHVMHGLVEHALGMMCELQDSRWHTYGLRHQTQEGLAAIGLDSDGWNNHLASRTANVVWEIAADVVQEMDARIRLDDPSRTKLRVDGMAGRIRRRMHYVRRTLYEIEAVVGNPNHDILVAERLKMTSHQIRIDEEKGGVFIDATIKLQDMAQWDLAIPVHDHGTLDAGIYLEISGIEHTAEILLGRRIDRDKREMEEDDPALVAVPLVSALRWRENPVAGEYPPGVRLHINEEIALPKGVVVDGMSGDTSWIEIPQQLPDTIVDGMTGRPVTDLITHAWLDPRMKVCSGFTGSRSTRLLIEMPVVRLSKIDDADSDPHEAWRELQRQARRAREQADGRVRGRGRAIATQVSSGRRKSQETRAPITARDRERIVTWRIAIGATLLVVILLEIAMLLRW